MTKDEKSTLNNLPKYNKDKNRKDMERYLLEFKFQEAEAKLCADRILCTSTKDKDVENSKVTISSMHTVVELLRQELKQDIAILRRELQVTNDTEFRAMYSNIRDIRDTINSIIIPGLRDANIQINVLMTTIDITQTNKQSIKRLQETETELMNIYDELSARLELIENKFKERHDDNIV